MDIFRGLFHRLAAIYKSGQIHFKDNTIRPMCPDNTIVDRSERIPLIIANMYRSGTLLDVGCGGIKHSTFDLLCATGDYDLVVGVDAHKPSVDERIAWANSRADSHRFSHTSKRAVSQIQYIKRRINDLLSLRSTYQLTLVRMH